MDARRPPDAEARTARQAARRAVLLDGAIEAIRAEGPAVSMDRIAALAGVTKPVLYRAFGSKEGLYQAVADWYVAQFLSDIATTIDTRVDFGDFVSDLVDVLLARIEGDASVYHFLMRRARMALTSAAHHADDDFFRRLGDLVGEFVAAELVRIKRSPESGQVWGHAIVGMVNNAADWWLDQEDLSREQMVVWLAPILYHGFDSYRGLPRVP